MRALGFEGPGGLKGNSACGRVPRHQQRHRRFERSSQEHVAIRRCMYRYSGHTGGAPPQQSWFETNADTRFAPRAPPGLARRLTGSMNTNKRSAKNQRCVALATQVKGPHRRTPSRVLFEQVMHRSRPARRRNRLPPTPNSAQGARSAPPPMVNGSSARRLRSGRAKMAGTCKLKGRRLIGEGMPRWQIVASQRRAAIDGCDRWLLMPIAPRIPTLLLGGPDDHELRFR